MSDQPQAYTVGLGELLWDCFPGGRTPGGATANFAYHVAQFGLPALVASAVGRDVDGDSIEALLRSRGVETLLERNNYPTGTVTVKVDPTGIPAYTIHEGVAWDHIRFTPQLAALAADCRAVGFGTLGQRAEPSRESIQHFLDAMPPQAWRIFDINLRQHFYTDEIILRALKRCNLLKINDEELPTLAHIVKLSDSDPAKLCSTLRKNYGLRAVVLTCGVRGSYVFTTDEVLFRKTPRVNVIDTVGAGDSFTGALCATLLRGRSFSEAHELAVDTAAFVCTQSGGMPLLPRSLTDRLL